MGDILLKKCCGTKPDSKVEGGTMYFFCPVCGRKSHSISYNREYGCYELNRIDAQSIADMWNEEVNDG